jgi:hypothetical protein
MKIVLIDSSKEWIGIIIGEEAILKILNAKLKRSFGKNVHMRELETGEKFSVLRIFNQIFSRQRVRLYSFLTKNSKFWPEFVKSAIDAGVHTFYVDLEISQELRRKVHPFYLRQLNVYTDKKSAQCADILAYGDSHHKLVRNIWKDISITRGELRVE